MSRSYMTSSDLLPSAVAPRNPWNEGDIKVNIRNAEVVHLNQQVPTIHSSDDLSSNRELILSIQETLKERYRDAVIHSFLWDDNELDYPLEGYSVHLNVEERDLMGVFAMGNTIPLKNIFFSEDEYGRRSRRKVLISGDSGYGKTTLAKRICYDWATLDPTSYISHFDIVVNIPLITTGPVTVEESIRNCLEVDEETFRTIIDMKLQWLLILDGLDEASKTDEALVFLRETFREYYANSTFILTSRPYSIKNTRNLFDHRLCILGLSKENQRNYIKAVFSPNIEKEEAMISEIETDAFLGKVSECPLLLYMICCVYGTAYDTGTSNITSRTMLYVHIFNLLRIRYLNKYGKSNIIKEKNIVYNELFIALGKFARTRIHLSSTYLITEEDLRKEFSEEEHYNVVLRFVILLGIPTRFNMKVITKYEFFHRTFSEFLQAIYIVHRIQTSSEDFLQAPKSSDDLGTAIFVAGLMGMKFIEDKRILGWISREIRTVSELAEIRYEAFLDVKSWELMCFLIKRIEYNHTLSERHLLYTDYTLSNIENIEIKTEIVNEEFWKCTELIMQGCNSNTKFSFEFPVSVVQFTSLESSLKIDFIDMENVMNELVNINNFLLLKRHTFFRFRIYPTVVHCRTEGEDCGTINITQNLKEPVGLLAESFCPAPYCEMYEGGGMWQFGKIVISYDKQLGIVKEEQNKQEVANTFPILVITEAEYCRVRETSCSCRDIVKVVNFKKFPMSSTLDDFKTPKYLGEADTIEVSERLLKWQTDLDGAHGCNCGEEVRDILRNTLSSRKREICIIT